MPKSSTAIDSPRFILSAQYFLYFGVMGIILPYFNLYCYHIGFDGLQIGVLSALRTGTIVLFPLFWGVLADRFQLRKPIYIFCSFASTVIWIFYLYTTDFWMMVAIGVVYGMFYAPIISFLEAFTMDLLGREKRTYGTVRVWGTLSFILVAVVLGWIIDAYPIRIILVLVLAGSILQAFMSIRIPDVKAQVKESYRSGASVLLKMRSVVFLFCAFLMLMSHGAYYGFFSIHLENLGYGNAFIGIAWALASASEVLVMINSHKIFKRFSLENVLIFSFVIAAIRWLTLFYVTTASAICVSQVLHAITYGTFHMASILYIDRLIPGSAKTIGQAVNNAVTYGLGMMAGFFLSGYFFDKIGSSMLFAVSGLIALFAGVIFLGFEKFGKKYSRD